MGRERGWLKHPAPAQPWQFAGELLPPSFPLSLLLFPSLPLSFLPSRPSLYHSVSTGSRNGERSGEDGGGIERSGNCFNLPIAMKRNQAAGVSKSRESALIPYPERKPRPREVKTRFGQHHVDLPSNSPVFLLLLSTPRFSLGSHPSLSLSMWLGKG